MAPKASGRFARHYHLTHEAARSHSECLFHQTSEGNLAGAFEIRLPGLHSHHIRQLQLERKECVSTPQRWHVEPGDSPSRAAQRWSVVSAMSESGPPRYQLSSPSR